MHADHITGADTIRTKTGYAKVVYGSRAGVNGCDICLEDKQTISLGKHNIKAIHTPGHTSQDVLSYYVKVISLQVILYLLEVQEEQIFKGDHQVIHMRA